MKSLVCRLAVLTLVHLASFAYAFAQDSKSARIQPSCGPSDVQFEVGTSKRQPDATMEPGKAQVYVIQVVRTPFFEPASPTIRVAVDGSWIGATKGNSYVNFSVDPGEHHLCVQWQSSLKSRSDKAVFSSLSAEEGKKYYFRSLFTWRGHALDLERLDPDEGRFLVSSSALSIPHPKK